MDSTAAVRRLGVKILNSEIESKCPISERKRLEEIYGQVWSTDELTADFTVRAFNAPFVSCTNKSGEKGCLMFQDRPRFYFSWKKH